jgi:threonine synthase
MPTIRCTQCHLPYPEAGLPYLCPACGGVYDYDGPFDFHLERVDNRQLGIWRYRHAFALPENARMVSLGEGHTPLVPLPWGKTVYLKLDGLNPTGSYKDRGSAVMLSALRARGATQAVEDSSGNAGASFAAYAARAGLQAHVFVPESASGPKRSQIELYGAQLVRVPGPRSAAAEAVLSEVRQGAVYASHAYLPFGLAGIATLAYELWQQLGRAPGTVIAPVGHGGLLLGIVRGFAALKHAGLIEQVPYYVGVQAVACAPVVDRFSGAVNPAGAEGQTVAEGVRVASPVRAEALLREISPHTGRFVAIEEGEIMPAFHMLARLGIHIEPTSALAWAAYLRQAAELSEPVVLILTGTGLKYQAFN